MALITDREAPRDVPKSSDTLAGLIDPDAPPDPAEIRAFGKTLLTVANPPGAGDTIVFLVRLRVYDVGVEYNENGEGEGTPYRKAKLVSCWKPGTSEPVKPKTKAEEAAEAEAAAAEDQPALFDDDVQDAVKDDGSWDDDDLVRGQPNKDTATGVDELLDDTPETLGQAAEKIVDRPNFSDSSTK